MRPPLAAEQFDLEPGLTWVMHCAEGPIPRSAAVAASTFLTKESKPWRVDWNGDFIGLQLQLRRRAAALLGGREEDITLTPTTSSGLALVAQGLDWRAGDEVVVPLGEFPSNAWPWLALAPRGVSFREVPLWPGHLAGPGAWQSAPPPPDVAPERRLLEALGPRTRVLSVSWVRFQDGLRLDLETLAAGCRKRGVALVVDGIQGAGTLPVPLLDDVAAFATGGHKGLLAPQGQGFLWTDEAFRHQLAPPGGWLSVEGATDFTRPSTDLHRAWLPTGAALELGVPNLLGCAALGESLRTLLAASPAAIAAHVDGLQSHLLQALATHPSWATEAERLDRLRQRHRLGPILALHHTGRGPTALDTLLQAGFAAGVYASVREGYLRIALHGWHTASDLERIVEWLWAG